MRIAIPIWKGAVSSVFDFAHHLLLVDVEGQQETGRAQIDLEEQQESRRSAKLVDLGVDALICGAISRALAQMLAGQNIEVIPYVTGLADEVLDAYLSDQLTEPRFLLPGCWSRTGRGFGRRRRRGRKRHSRY